MRRPDPLRLAVNIVILVGGALLLYASVGVSWGLAGGRHAADIVGLWPSPAAETADTETRFDARRPDLAAVSSSALDIWQREPLAIGALRLIAATDARGGDPDRADRIYTYVETLTRRDQFTEMWLVNGALARNDTAATLRHADHAMRASMRTHAYLFNLLSYGAARSARFRQGVAALIAARPDYWPDLFAAMISADDDGAVIADLLAHAGLRVDVNEERGSIQAGISRLEVLGKLDEAYAAYLTFIPGRRADLLTNGGFESDPLLFPFDWQVLPEADLSSGGVARGGRPDRALNYDARDEAQHIFAQQLVVLPPGAYQLAFRYHAEAGPSPRALVTCRRQGVGSPTTVLSQRQADDRVTTTFTATAACRYHLVQLISGGSGAGWIDDVTLVPQSSAAPAS